MPLFLFEKEFEFFFKSHFSQQFFFQIVDGYMAHMRDPECDIVMPEDLRGGKDKMIFGNVEAIYEWHRE